MISVQNSGFKPVSITNIQPQSKPMFRFATNPVDKFEKKSATTEETLKELSKIKKDNKNRFTDNDIKSFSKMAPENLGNVKYFAQTNLSVFNIKWIIEKNDVNFEKLGKIIQNEEKEDKNASISFSKDSAENSNFILTVKSKNYEKAQVLDKNLNTLTKEITKEKGDFKYTEVKDFKNNTILKAKTDKDNILISSVKTFNDKNGNTLKTEYTKQSDIEGIYDIKVKNAKGKEEILSEGKVNKATGISTITKNLTSPDGTKTEYNCTFDKNGNKEFAYKITDKKGKILLDNKENFKVISENKAISTKNNKKYEIDYFMDKISIKNDKKTTEINLFDFAKGDTSPLKKISGNELIQMKNNVTKYGGSQGCFAAYDVFSKAVNTSDNKVSTLLHELGHAKDYRNKDMEISSDEKFVKTFETEKKAFTENSSNFERTLIEYFIRPRSHHAGENGGKVEAVAEANAILNAPADDKVTGMRKQIFQQYFPKTIAILNDKLEQFSNSPLQTNNTGFFGH